ncbi:glycosyltransferase [Nostocaceae cyanobacterium CENA357]|uniref:Glycosyltransferase n=1 Tax=Atlanticothrix silvestris CENA357 TaxID=1725252 RepID=A0A8J7H608_9CYAN|nr:glycosyltransferase [Atlanticothrix silvestris]MBH8551084.1 glycosyltransferase [Atlanticothrix silvestris CENA357]
MKSRKVLVSAYACRPNMGSEPGVGWNTVCELGKYHKIWVFTREDNRSYIEAELSNNPIPGLEFVYVDLPGSNWWKRSLGAVHLHHYLWQIKAYLLARKLHKEIGFDVSHHVTYVRYSSPSFISLLPIPFIWGPIGGGESAPKAFWKDFGFRGKIYEIIRITVHKLGEYDPFVRLTLRNSTLIRATTEDTAKRLWQMSAINLQIYSESGLSEQEIQQLAQCPIPNSGQIRFISMARLLHWKGIHLGIQAFAQADLPDDTEYWILGDGPERKRLQILAEELGVSKQVKLWGRLSRPETLDKLSKSNVLVHPSLHDSGGWVCLEAMAAGCPVICLDLGGPAVQVTAETGFKIQASTPEEAVCGLAEAMACLAQDQELRLSMGYAGQKLVAQSFNWSKKAELLAQLYEETVQDNEYIDKALA